MTSEGGDETMNRARRICANGVRSEKMRVDIVSIRFRNRRDDRLAVYNEGSLFSHSARFNRFFLFFSSLASSFGGRD